MRLHPQQSARLGRIFGYVGVALIAVWSLLALGTYAGVEALVAWAAGQAGAEGWLGSLLSTSATIDGPLIAVISAFGVVLLAGLTFGIRRMTAARR